MLLREGKQRYRQTQESRQNELSIRFSLNCTWVDIPVVVRCKSSANVLKDVQKSYKRRYSSKGEAVEGSFLVQYLNLALWKKSVGLWTIDVDRLLETAFCNMGHILEVLR